MVLDNAIEGEYVDLKSADIGDAEFSLKIRQDDKLTKYIPQINSSLERQEKWISEQRERKGDYFFIASDKRGKPIGTISLYEIKDNKAHIGRLIMSGNPFHSYEAYLLTLEFGFYKLGLDEVTGDVYEDNKACLNFTMEFGMVFYAPVMENGHMVCYGVIEKNEYTKRADEIKNLIYR